MPSVANMVVVVKRVALNGILPETIAPRNTAGASAINMPKVVPPTTAGQGGNSASSMTVAIRVLSPISPMAATVVQTKKAAMIAFGVRWQSNR